MRALMVLLVVLTAAPAGAVDLVTAAARVRVGDAVGAVEVLGLDPPKDEDARAVWGVLRARAHLLVGDGGGAREALDAVALPEPLVAVGYWLRLQAAVERGDDAAVKDLAGALLTREDAPQRLRDEATLRLAATQGAAGVPALMTLADHPVLGARALEGVAGASRGAARDEALRRLLVEHPDTPPGRRAAAARDPQTLAPADQRARAERLFAQRAYDLVEPDLARIAADERQPAEARQQARLTQAIARMRLREDYVDALSLLDRVIAGEDAKLADEAWFRRGLVLGNLQRWDDARAAMLTYLDRAPRGRFALSAGYQVGRLMHQGGRYDAALADHARFLAVRRPDHVKWAWFVGWAHFRKGDCPGARAAWADMLDRDNLLEGPKARYWSARCHAIEGDRAAAAAQLAALARHAPLSYYGLLGAAFGASLRGEPAALPARPKGWPITPPTMPDLRPVERRLGKHAAQPLRAVRLLVAVGYPDLARGVDVPSYRRTLGRKGEARLESDLDLLLERHAGAWKKQASKRLPWNAGLAAAGREAAAEAYPPAWLPLARAAGRLHDVSPWWLLSHALQESRFKHRARSHAGALGPMQILPRTGHRIAARMGYPRGDFFDDALFEPGVALRQAAWYLDALRAEFGDVPLLAAAAYNGGPLRVADHLETVGDVPFDVMMEEIGAHETRNYARKITDHVVRNATLWAPDGEREALLRSFLPPPTVPKPAGELRF
jgi:soluble lytic murein transglycosylase-like protein